MISHQPTNSTKSLSSVVAAECSSLLLHSNTTSSNLVLLSTPLYQVVAHALSDKSNKTKFTLLFSNVTEKDILLREELDALQKQHPGTFNLIYLLDKPGKDWTGTFFPIALSFLEAFLLIYYVSSLFPFDTGPSGYISADVIQQHVGPASLKEKVKIFVCGTFLLPSSHPPPHFDTH